MNEKQLRTALRHETPKGRAFSGIATKGSPSAFQFSTVDQVFVFGKGNKRTVFARSICGRKSLDYTLCTVTPDAQGYAEAAEIIEMWEQA